LASSTANAALVLAATDELRRAGWTIPEDACVETDRCVWPGAVEVVARQPVVVFDAAPQGLGRALIEVLAEFSARQRLLVFATPAKKTFADVQPLLGWFDHVVYRY